MAELSTLSPEDRRVLTSPQGKAALAKLVPYLPLIKLQLPTIRPHVPSYVGAALDELVAAVDRWQKDAEDVS